MVQSQIYFQHGFNHQTANQQLYTRYRFISGTGDIYGFLSWVTLENCSVRMASTLWDIAPWTYRFIKKSSFLMVFPKCCGLKAWKWTLAGDNWLIEIGQSTRSFSQLPWHIPPATVPYVPYTAYNSTAHYPEWVFQMESGVAADFVIKYSLSCEQGWKHRWKPVF